MSCEHLNFDVHAFVNRLSQTEAGPITGYTMDVEVRCADCKQIFAFVGLPGGLNPDFPTVSADGCELRAPIVPFNPFIP